VNGLLIVEIKGDSEAAKRGMRPGDVINEVNGEAVKTPADLKAAFDAAKKSGRKNALVKIVHEGEEAFVALPTEEEKKADKKDKDKDN